MIHRIVALALMMSVMISCSNGLTGNSSGPTVKTDPAPAHLAKATFAGGCFWCMEKPFDQVVGVVETTVGYTGGHHQSPSYNEVAAGVTDQIEAIEIVYDPKKVTYEKLIDVFWRNINPTQTDGQFADRGNQYKTAIFFHSPDQEQTALESKGALDASKKFDLPIYTKVRAAGAFWRAEKYHQAYYKKNPGAYTRYHRASGRAAYIERVWN